MNTQVATQERRDVAAPAPPLQQQIAQMKDKFQAALPAHVPVERFTRFGLLALTKPEIQKAAATSDGRRSIYDALLKCAADGLLPDGREAALVAYRTKDKASGEYRTLV